MPRRPTTEQLIRDLLAEYEPEMQKAFLEAVQEMRDGVQLQQLVEALKARNLEAAIAAVNIDRAVFRELENVYAKAFEAGGVVGAGGFPKVPDPNGGVVIVRFDTRMPTAERILREASSTMVTRISNDTKTMLRTVMSEGLEVGRGPMAMATDIAGRVSRTSNRREGGILGMTSVQERAVSSARQKLLSGDPSQMREYLGLKLRDKRFDRTVLKAINEGAPVSREMVGKITGRLTDRYVQFRAETVARTETLGSVNAGRHEAFRQGLDKTEYTEQDVTREWDDAGDAKVRNDHRGVSKVRGLSQPFDVGGSLMMHPGDTSLGAGAEQVINCRCVEKIKIDFFRGMA